VVPDGPYAPPGEYQVTLTVDGQSRKAALRVDQDPRTQVPAADFQASLALSRTIAASLALARRDFGEMAAAHDQLAAAVAALKAKQADPGLVARALALEERAAPPNTGPSFPSASRTLGGIEADLESADLAPTQPQREAVEAGRGQIEALWTAWASLRDGDLPALDTALAAAGVRAVVIPPPDKLVVAPPAGGEDLP
jgi:hypothetical protein